MTRTRSFLHPLLAIGVLLAAVLALAVPAAAPAVSAEPPPAAVLYRVHRPTPAQLAVLATGYDLLERRSGADYFVLGEPNLEPSLTALGLSVSVAQRLAPLPVRAVDRVGKVRPEVARPGAPVQASAYATFFGGYHTTAAQQQHLFDVAAAYPGLATVVPYGDSWLKTQGRGGNDLLAICITRKRSGDCALRPSAKPRSVVYAAIHARELATAEVAWNWIDYLTQNYGTDAAVTSLLNSTELWVIPVANPDGRQIVESGGSAPYFQRKNADDDRGNCRQPPTSYNQFGVDMNRNATFQWGGVGSTNSACAQTYRGTSPASEPETGSQQALFGELFADRRGPGLTDAAPADTTGTFISYHSFASLTLYPWGFTKDPAPNQAKLKEIADGMARFTGYTTGQGPVILYGTSGTTDDDLYGRLGVASFTTELGAAGTSCDGFMPPYSCVGSKFWPQERQALLYLAGKAAGPYR